MARSFVENSEIHGDAANCSLTVNCRSTHY